jgi:hypothetical protein
MDCSQWCICCCLSYYLGCGSLFIGTICYEEYKSYKKIKNEYQNFARENGTNPSINITTIGQKDYERLYPLRNVVLSRIEEEDESITEY